MIGIQYDLVEKEAIYQGADWYKEFQLIDPDTLLPYDLTGYAIASKGRKRSTDVAAAFTFTSTVSDASQGIVKIALTNVQTSAIPKGNYKYDVEASEPAPSSIIHKAIIPSVVQVVEEYTK